MVGSRDTPIKIYRIVCISNGKVYVGVTKGSLAKRWAKHVYEAKKRDYLFGRAILKYGNRAFLIEHIASAATQRQKIAAALIGRTFSDERRAVQSAAIKAWWAARKATKAGVLL